MYYIDPFNYYGSSGLSRDGNSTAEHGPIVIPSAVTVGGKWFDSRIFWHYNVVDGYTIPLQGVSQHHKQTTIPAYFTPTGKNDGHGAATGIQRVPGTEGDTELERAQGWGGDSHYGWNLWWAGNSKGAELVDTTDAPPENLAAQGVDAIELQYGGDRYAYNTDNNIPRALGSFCFRSMQGPTTECPIYTGTDLGPKLFHKTTGLNAPYEVPGAFPNAPMGSLMFQINLAYWGLGKTKADGHDSYYVIQPPTPGLRRQWTQVPKPSSYVLDPETQLSPLPRNITDGFAFTYDLKIIGREGDPVTNLGRYWIDRSHNLGFTPILSPGDKAHTHTWDLTNCTAPPDWASHLRFLVKGYRQNLHYITNAFLGGPPS
jgi:hypothetical protein